MENFDLKEMVRQAIKEIATEELIDYQIREAVRDRFSYKVEKEIQAAAMDFVREKGDGYIREKIDAIMNGHVRTDDGWGNVEDHGTFEDYVRKAIGKQCRDQWNIERKVREEVDERLKKYCKEVTRGKIEEESEKVLAKLAAEYAAKGEKP